MFKQQKQPQSSHNVSPEVFLKKLRDSHYLYKIKEIWLCNTIKVRCKLIYTQDEPYDHYNVKHNTEYKFPLKIPSRQSSYIRHLYGVCLKYNFHIYLLI